MYQDRRNQYLEKIEKNTLTLFFSGKQKVKSQDQFFPFHVNHNFYYLTGIDQENVCLMLAKGDNDTKAYLFLEETDPIKALWDGSGLTFNEAANVSGIELENIKDIKNLDQMISNLLSASRRALFGYIDTIYFDLERLNEKVENSLSIDYSNYLKNLFPYLNLKSNHMILAELRTVKDSDEVETIKKAIHITKVGLDRILKNLAPGKFEFQMVAEYNYVLNLHQTIPSFEIIAASSKNATILHYVKNNSAIPNHSLVLFDLGVYLDHYASDITRTYPANGKFSQRQKEIYEVVLNANKKSIEFLKPGITLKEFNEYGKSLLIEGAKKIGLIKEDQEIIKYYYHSLGHYLGLDVHDVGNYTLPIPEGAIITVEPGLYIAEENIGIRIEDDILITKDGSINLSKEILKEVDEIEALMKK
jgi:Xaa-Pro aminopeptidase